MKVGAETFVSDDIKVLSNATLLVVPGVGAFDAAMKVLRQKKLDVFVRDWIKAGRPYFGICLGFQLLFESSEESPKVKGLTALKGKVVSFKKKNFKKTPFIVPHMGWNTTKTKWESPIYKGISSENSFYFVHTYFPVPTDKNVIFTETEYGAPFCSSIQFGNIFATQFHPEKSGQTGLRLMGNVLTWAGNFK
jgi:imidazole glycerol phosphate synthase glutamine amidotransferase subunit